MAVEQTLRTLQTKVVYIGLTNVCNLNCTYCLGLGIRAGTMSEQTLNSVVSFCSEQLNPIQWSFQGGEVFLFQDLLLSALKQVPQKSALTITTNGTKAFEQSLLDFVLQNNVLVRVSMDNFPQIHDQVRGKGLATFKFLLDALESRINLQICITVVPGNVVGMAKWARFLFDLGIQHVVIFPVVEAGWTAKQIQIYQQETRLVKELRSQYGISDPVSSFCGRYNQQVWIDFTGGIWPCHMAYYMQEKLTSVVGVLPRLGDIWSGIDWNAFSQYNQFELSNRKECRECAHYNTCTMCWVADYLGNGVCPSKTACALGLVN